jgi:hypothetical protein
LTRLCLRLSEENQKQASKQNHNQLFSEIDEWTQNQLKCSTEIERVSRYDCSKDFMREVLGLGSLIKIKISLLIELQKEFRNRTERKKKAKSLCQ